MSLLISFRFDQPTRRNGLPLPQAMSWRRLHLDECDRVAGDYSSLVRPLSALRSLLGAEADNINEDWSLLHASVYFLDDGVRVGLTVDEVRLTARVLAPELLLTVIRLQQATKPRTATWRSARITVHRVGYITVDFFAKHRGYRIVDWLILPKRRYQPEFDRLARGVLRP